MRGIKIALLNILSRHQRKLLIRNNYFAEDFYLNEDEIGGNAKI